jgi:hypothetical protein
MGIVANNYYPRPRSGHRARSAWQGRQDSRDRRATRDHKDHPALQGLKGLAARRVRA